MRFLFLHRPAFRNNPATGLARGNHQYLDVIAVGNAPEAERGILLAKISTLQMLGHGCELKKQSAGRGWDGMVCFSFFPNFTAIRARLSFFHQSISMGTITWSHCLKRSSGSRQLQPRPPSPQERSSRGNHVPMSGQQPSAVAPTRCQPVRQASGDEAL